MFRIFAIPSVSFQKHNIPNCIRCLSKSSSSTTNKRRLDVAIVGAPNAGKSQLLNILCGETVAAVSRKRHTTRSGILGLAHHLSSSSSSSSPTTQRQQQPPDTQLVFWDTPGFLRPKSAKQEGLTRDLIVSAMAEMVHVDYTLLVIDAARNFRDVEDYRESLVELMLCALTHSQGRVEEILLLDQQDGGQKEALKRPDERLGIVLNKVDLVNPKTELLGMADEFGSMAEACIDNYLESIDAPQDVLDSIKGDLFPTIFYTSALEDEGVEDISRHLVNLATPSMVWADVTARTLERIEEVIREKIYRCLHREIPHQIHQVNRAFQERGDGVYIYQQLVVKTKSHYTIVNGKARARIEETAKRDLQSLFPGKPVHLKIHVKWSKTQYDRPLDPNTEGVLNFPTRRHHSSPIERGHNNR